jgi:hypothetical protein
VQELRALVRLALFYDKIMPIEVPDITPQMDETGTQTVERQEEK